MKSRDTRKQSIYALRWPWRFTGVFFAPVILSGTVCAGRVRLQNSAKDYRCFIVQADVSADQVGVSSRLQNWGYERTASCCIMEKDC